MKPKPMFLIAGLLATAVLSLTAQETAKDSELESYIDSYKSFSRNYIQEKVYLHFDNTAYYLGENIWFKAYVVRADNHSLADLSKVLYVDLVSAEGHIIETKKFKIEHGQCHGDIFLPPVYYAGFYEVRAYTRYMLNFDGQNYFSRVFPVYDQPAEDGDYVPTITERPFSQRVSQIRPEYLQNKGLNIQFFPEGGELVKGIRSKVAFKATGKEGENAYVMGTLYNEQDEKITEFSTQYQGMGMFTFTPNSGNYYVEAQYKGRNFKFDLPGASESGFILNVDNLKDDKVTMIVSKSPSIAEAKLGLSISSRGILYGFEELHMSDDNTYLLNFPKRNLPSGISQITLFDQSGRAVSERFVFINHNSQLKITATQNKVSYEPLERINVSFNLTGPDDQPVETTFSVAVRDAANSSLNPYDDNLMANLLLSSELKGYIENPGFYFENDDPSRRQALDLLLMTQGWTRYHWEKMAGVESFEIEQPMEEGLYLEGSIVSLSRKKPMSDVDLLMILYTDSISQNGTYKTDSTGAFYFPLHDFTGNAKLILESKQKDKRKEMRIRLDRQFSPDFKMYSYSEHNAPLYFKTVRDTVITADSLTADIVDELQRLIPENNDKLPLEKRNILLAEVEVKKRRSPVKINLVYNIPKVIDKRKDNGEWVPADLQGLLTFTDPLFAGGRYKNKQVLFISTQSTRVVPNVTELLDVSASGPNGGTNTGRLHNPDFPYLDEIESVTFIEDFSSIYRIYNDFIDPTTTCIGLIRLKTDYVREPYGIRNTTYDGYAYTKEFYVPEYDKIKLPEEKDYRRTLYWNPDVTTDPDGKATISFYNNSSCENMVISAETVTENGMMGSLNR